MPWISEVKAILQAWYLGSEAGNAIANVITGKVNPSGKLPFSIPVKIEDCGAHSFDKTSYPGDSINVYYKEDILVGYRWYDTKKIPVAFSFGHGLSYTQFNYGKIASTSKYIQGGDTLKITLSIKNIGAMRGAEVVQLYIHDIKSSVLRPLKELKSFAKVELAPGEEKNITFSVTENDLQFFSENENKFVAEKGDFEILIGSSSTDIRQKVRFTFN
jgi:beta-glucosidase